jgi:hypothetical protein
MMVAWHEVPGLGDLKSPVPEIERLNSVVLPGVSGDFNQARCNEGKHL